MKSLLSYRQPAAKTSPEDNLFVWPCISTLVAAQGRHMNPVGLLEV